MAERKIVVPEGMYDAAMKYQDSGIQCGAALEAALEAALRWLSENPIVPTLEQEAEMDRFWLKKQGTPYTIVVCTEWQRRMFLAPEPEVPEAIKDLIFSGGDSIPNKHIIEAYRRGQKAGKP